MSQFFVRSLGWLRLEVTQVYFFSLAYTVFRASRVTKDEGAHQFKEITEPTNFFRTQVTFPM